MRYENVHTARLFRSVRLRHGLSLRAMAKRLGTSSSTLNRIEDAHTAPKPIVVERLLALEETQDLEALFIQAYL